MGGDIYKGYINWYFEEHVSLVLGELFSFVSVFM